MKLALIGTGKIVEDALFAMEPVETIERTAIFARPHSRDKAEKLAKQTDADGGILFAHWGCKGTIGASGLITGKDRSRYCLYRIDQQCSLSICKTGIISGKECHPREAIYWIL